MKCADVLRQKSNSTHRPVASMSFHVHLQETVSSLDPVVRRWRLCDSMMWLLGTCACPARVTHYNSYWSLHPPHHRAPSLRTVPWSTSLPQNAAGWHVHGTSSRSLQEREQLDEYLHSQPVTRRLGSVCNACVAQQRKAEHVHGANGDSTSLTCVARVLPVEVVLLRQVSRLASASSTALRSQQPAQQTRT